MEINLFNYDQEPKEPPKKITYSSLNIHQRINFRANKGNAFYGTVFKSRYYFFHQAINPMRDPFDSLKKIYFIEYYLNAGGFNRLDNWKKERQKPNLFNQKKSK